jgi:putative flavoprotein involved in K+ transport
VVATGGYQAPRIPAFAHELDATIRQFHSSEYRDPSQLLPGPVLVVGASNSGAEIALAASVEHRVILAGRDTGKTPVRPESRMARLFDPPFWFVINRVLRTDTPLGRRAIPFVRDHGLPLERVKPRDLEAAGIERVTSRVDGVIDGKPRLDDGRTLEVGTVVWCTGFRPRFDWIEVSFPLDDGWPMHDRGVVEQVPGLYFIGLPFLYTAASSLMGGVGRDAAHLAGVIERRAQAQRLATGAVTDRAARGAPAARVVAAQSGADAGGSKPMR